MKAPVQMSEAVRERLRYIESCGAKLKRSKRVLAKGVCIRNMRRRLKRELQAEEQERRRRSLSLETMHQGNEWQALRQYEKEQRARERQQNICEDNSNLPGVDPNVFAPVLLTRSSSFIELSTRRSPIDNDLFERMQTIEQGRELKQVIPTASEEINATPADDPPSCIPQLLTRSSSIRDMDTIPINPIKKRQYVHPANNWTTQCDSIKKKIPHGRSN